jgi:hypothetical protein
LIALGKKSAIDAAVGVLLEKNKGAGSEIAMLRKTMVDIAEIKFGVGTRPYKFMMHFLNGNGADREIDLAELFRDDRTVKDRVTSEVYRRVLGARTAKEKADQQRMTSVFPNGIDPVITIFQTNYSNTGWLNSLGTYDIHIEHVQSRLSPGSPICVTLTSKNVYRWHSADKRITQTIHMIGQTLVDLGEAHNFAMTTKRTRMLIDPKYAELLSMVTISQNNPHIEHTTFNLEAIARGTVKMFEF